MARRSIGRSLFGAGPALCEFFNTFVDGLSGRD
jgi:hypothetical protein